MYSIPFDIYIERERKKERKKEIYEIVYIYITGSLMYLLVGWLVDNSLLLTIHEINMLTLIIH